MNYYKNEDHYRKNIFRIQIICEIKCRFIKKYKHHISLERVMTNTEIYVGHWHNFQSSVELNFE